MAEKAERQSEGAGSSSVALGDIDRDSDLDALVGHGKGVSIWIKQGGSQGGRPAQFMAADQRLSGRQTRNVRLADLDGDSDLDAIVVGKRKADLCWNDGRGPFSASNP